MAEKYTSLEHAIRDIVERKNDPCWDGYKQVGMKKKNGKDVPNCVPEETDSMTQAILEGGHTLEENTEKLDEFKGVEDLGAATVRAGSDSTDLLDRILQSFRIAASRYGGDSTIINPETAARPDALINPETAIRAPALFSPSAPEIPTTQPLRVEPETRPAPVRTSPSAPTIPDLEPAPTRPETVPARVDGDSTVRVPARTATETEIGTRTAEPTTGRPRGEEETAATVRAAARGRGRGRGIPPSLNFSASASPTPTEIRQAHVATYQHYATPALRVNEDATVERSKIENVARPSARRDKVVKQQEIQKKIIDENRSLAATVKKNVEETRKRERNSSPIITNPKTNDPDPDGYPGGY